MFNKGDKSIHWEKQTQKQPLQQMVLGKLKVHKQNKRDPISQPVQKSTHNGSKVLIKDPKY